MHTEGSLDRHIRMKQIDMAIIGPRALLDMQKFEVANIFFDRKLVETGSPEGRDQIPAGRGSGRFLLFYYDRGQKGPDLPTYLA